MGGMDNYTSINLAHAKQNARKRNSKRDEILYKEYSESNAQFIQTFIEWKKSRRKKKRIKKEKMQKPLTKKQLEERGYDTKLSLNNVRWK